MRLSSLFTLLLIFNLCLFNTASASLLISPTRVVIDDRERSAKVIVMNTGDTVKTYRLNWTQNRGLSGGSYQELTEEETKNFPIASPMFRISPKQVTLAPGQKQIIKLLARRPKNLADGEYRSHLNFIILPDKEKESAENELASIKLNILLSYSIPAILRQGKKDYAFAIQDTKLDIINNGKKTEVVVDISRSGLTSLYGNFKAYWTPEGSNNEVKVAELNSTKIYPEVAQSTYRLFWQNDNLKNKKGTLRVYFEGLKEFKDIIFDEKIIKL